MTTVKDRIEKRAQSDFDNRFVTEPINPYGKGKAAWAQYWDESMAGMTKEHLEVYSAVTEQPLKLVEFIDSMRNKATTTRKRLELRVALVIFNHNERNNWMEGSKPTDLPKNITTISDDELFDLFEELLFSNSGPMG